MRSPIMLTTVTLVALLVVGSNNASTASAGRFAVPISKLTSLAASPAGQATPTFSSGYTALTKCGSGMTKKEEKEAEAQGSDIPTRCKGYGGYDVYISYSACASSITLEKGEENIPLAMQAVDWKQKTVEWRLANGKPFAVIMRVYDYKGTNECAMAGKIIGESLIVKGLKGFEQIDGTVNVNGTPNPNVKAREIADKGYARLSK